MIKIPVSVLFFASSTLGDKIQTMEEAGKTEMNVLTHLIVQNLNPALR